MKRRLIGIGAIALSALLLAGGRVAAWSGAVEDFVTSLNQPAARQALGVQQVWQPEGVANRLEVTFQEQTPAAARAQVLQTIGRKFVMALFEERMISFASVVERSTSGAIVNQVSVRITAGPRPSSSGC